MQICKGMQNTWHHADHSQSHCIISWCLATIVSTARQVRELQTRAAPACPIKRILIYQPAHQEVGILKPWRLHTQQNVLAAASLKWSGLLPRERPHRHEQQLDGKTPAQPARPNEPYDDEQIMGTATLYVIGRSRNVMKTALAPCLDRVSLDWCSVSAAGSTAWPENLHLHVPE